MSQAQSPFKQDLLSGQVVLCTGGSSGIGLEISRQLGLHGAAVAITGRRQQVLDDAVAALRAEGITALGLQGDVRKVEDCERWAAATASQLGRLDILVNCAAGNFLAAAEELSVNGFRTVMEIDAVGTFSMSRAAFPELRKSGRGSIINISMTLHYGATHFQTHAMAAKSAVDAMTRGLALEWGEYGIRTNGIAPGPIAGTAGASKLGPGARGDSGGYAASIPLKGRMGETWDIAMAALYLASPAARFVSGATLVVDGANWLWKPPVVPRHLVSKVSRGAEKGSRELGLAQRPSKL